MLLEWRRPDYPTGSFSPGYPEHGHFVVQGRDGETLCKLIFSSVSKFRLIGLTWPRIDASGTWGTPKPYPRMQLNVRDPSSPVASATRSVAPGQASVVTSVWLRERFHCASRQDPCFAASVVGGSPVMGDLPSIDAVPQGYLSVVLQRQ